MTLVPRGSVGRSGYRSIASGEVSQTASMGRRHLRGTESPTGSVIDRVPRGPNPVRTFREKIEDRGGTAPFAGLGEASI
jgi:hypothetical protein